MTTSFQWDIGVSMLTEYDADDFIGLQVDAYGEQDAGVHPYELHHLGGFAFRPLDPVVDADGNPDPTKACQVLFALEGGRGHAWALSDPRTNGVLPRLLKGESLMYGMAGQFIRCHADGSITLLTTDKGGDPTGNSVFFRVRPDGFEWVAPWGMIKFNANGFHVTMRDGPSLDLGFIGGLPGPLGSLGGYANISAPIVRVNGSAIRIGAKGSPTNGPVAMATPVAAILGAVATALQAIGVVVADLKPTSGAVGADQAAAATAITAASTAIASAVETISSSLSAA